MFIELVDHLRCVRPHEDSWLVAASSVMAGRHVVRGVLGCPVCGARYMVRDGIADFRGDAADAGPAGAAPASEALAPTEEEVMRAAALLLLTEVRGPVVLGGAWGALAPALAELAPAVYLIVNPVAPVPERTELSALLARGALPLAEATAHAVALDERTATDSGLLAGAARALRGGGRLLAPATAPLPEGVRELARDERHWIAEREPQASAPIALRRPSRP